MSVLKGYKTCKICTLCAACLTDISLQDVSALCVI